MIEIDCKFELPTHRTDKKLAIAGMYRVEDYITFRIQAISGAFSGEDSFCSTRKDLSAYSAQLTDMYNTLSGKAVLLDYDSDNFLQFEMHDTGSLTLTGQLGGSHREHFVKFEFDTDQTALPSFIYGLSNLFAVEQH